MSQRSSRGFVPVVAVLFVLAAVTGCGRPPRTELSLDAGAAALPAQAGADTFFTPPAPLPAGQPGDVIRSRPVAPGAPAARAMADA